MTDNFFDSYVKEVKEQQALCQARRDYGVNHSPLEQAHDKREWLERNGAKPTPVEVRAVAEYQAAKAGVTITNMHRGDFPNDRSAIIEDKDGKLFILSNATVSDPSVHHWTILNWVPTKDNMPPVTFSPNELDVILFVDPSYADEFDPSLIPAFQDYRPGQQLGSSQYYIINPTATDPQKRFITNRTTTRPYPNTAEAMILNSKDIFAKVDRLARGE